MIIIDPSDAYEKTYSLRFAGRNNKTVEISVPKLLLEREARKLGLTLEEAIKKLDGKWLFDHFEGAVAVLQLKEKREKKGAKEITT